MIALDFKQNGRKIGFRILVLLGITLLLFLFGAAGLFEKIEATLIHIPDYFKPMLGFNESMDLSNGKYVILFFSMIVEFYFLYIALMDSWDYVSTNEDRQRFLFLGNQLYSKTEYVLHGYVFLLSQFLIVWISYKVMLIILGGSLFIGIPTILNGVGIYVVIVALGYLVSVLGISRGISPEFLFIISIFLFVVGNSYKFFTAMNLRLVEQGEFPNETWINLASRTKGLHSYSLLSYLNPFQTETFGSGIKSMLIGVFIAVALLALTVFTHRQREY